MAKSTRNRSDNAAGLDRPALKRVMLSYDERAEVGRRIAAKIERLGENPHRPVSPDWDPEAGDYPHPRNRWIFPSVAYSRAGVHARDFWDAMRDHDTSHFRLVTLRLQKQPPKNGALGAHLEGISAAFNGAVRYLIRKGIARPELSAVHLRYDTGSGRIDPHVHGIWEIPPELIERARALLQKTFGGGAWIDEKPVDDLRKASFYICSGVVDHPTAPDWPLAVLGEVWRLSPHVHYVRPAGRYAEWIKRHKKTGGGGGADKPTPGDVTSIDSASSSAQGNYTDSPSTNVSPAGADNIATPTPLAQVFHLLFEIAKSYDR